MANTMSMTARERTSEYATLKALGFSPAFVAGLIAAESMLLAVIGGLIGIAVTYPLASLFHSATGTLFKSFVVSLETNAMQMVAALVTGVFAALWPAIKSYRIRIVEGLRAI
jgi:putative ABC transport system permease protein